MPRKGMQKKADIRDAKREARKLCDGMLPEWLKDVIDEAAVPDAGHLVDRNTYLLHLEGEEQELHERQKKILALRNALYTVWKEERS